ncbi:hypothetical protein K3740_06655 [Ruegeria conchae]|uniref:hypothetical protein n=1 Tax=Ruegeria conchae TaxID=981384 RepID=UPI0021A53D26|nr:hypothetical protein [Ruegeria conchae]UWR04356.1 hypothetical protein K3740_06655 [Ruegeria conchae]
MLDIEHPGTAPGEIARALKARMFNHDIRAGLGGYYISRQDVKRLRDILGEDFDAAMSAAGFEPHPRHRHQYWTGPRSPAGDGAKIRFEPPWQLLKAVIGHFGGDKIGG